MKGIRIGCIAAPGMVPGYQSAGSSGADLRADIDGDILLAPGDHRSIPTGVRLELPLGIEAQIRPRSGLAQTHGVTVLNAPGTIDSDFRGELRVILINCGREPFTVKRGERIAQIVFAEVVRGRFEVRSSISTTERGASGFGSTGR
jgi:dUTP pyrophosphatase